MRTLDKLKARPHVAHVDDERGIGNSLLITLAAGYCFTAEPGCGVRGYDTVKDAEEESRASGVYRVPAASATPDPAH
jgi:hypothetical protein